MTPQLARFIAESRTRPVDEIATAVLGMSAVLMEIVSNQQPRAREAAINMCVAIVADLAADGRAMAGK